MKIEPREDVKEAETGPRRARKNKNRSWGRRQQNLEVRS
jgi:hypothetical protein